MGKHTHKILDLNSRLVSGFAEESDHDPGLVALSKRIQASDMTVGLGHSQAFKLGEHELPDGAVVIAHEIKLDADFGGGGVSSCVVDLGDDSIYDVSIVDEFDILGSDDGGVLYSPGYSAAPGTHPQGNYGGKQMLITVTVDNAKVPTDLTDGDMTVTIWYHILPTA